MSEKLLYLLSSVLVLSMVGNASAELVAYWAFDEDSGDIVTDTSGNANHGTIHGAVWGEGKYGPALGSPGSGGHVDDNVFGIVPLEIYLNNGEDAYRQDGLALADQQVADIDSQIRMAIDDMFMITGLQCQAYRATGEDIYLDTAAATMVLYLDDLQEEDGCFFQLPSVTRGKWGRGNGWFAAGMAEILQELDPAHEHYPRILDGYLDMMAGLLLYQRESGLWQQVIDVETPDNWDETSGSSMFTFAFVTGVKLGLLDAATYAPAAREAWLALADMVDSNGNLQNVSQWCYASGGDSVSYYLGRAKETGNDHGQAPLLWAAAALLK